MKQHSPIITIMLEAVRKSSRGLVRDFGEVENLQVSRKGPGDFVSAADFRSEKILIRELQKAYSEYSILSEESGLIEGTDNEYRWIMDPLDGTTNFLHGLSYFCTTIALEKKYPNGRREIIAAVTESPILQETFWAEKGKGAWLESGHVNGSMRLRVGARTKISEALLAIGSFSTDIKSVSKVSGEAVATRCLGSTALALAYVAAGRLDCFVHSGGYPWDIAAGVLLMTEAGGYVSDFRGTNKMFETRTIVASNSDLNPLLIKKISE
ncbi:MAG: extragenic suppressor protein SuhB [Rickettsiaceae bacterium]|jgi:myo-inositol-1(or 4)-monophosphatase|nr:extragenic suppressor protein SuhB [Rickettsiaceae bacterium]